MIYHLQPIKGTRKQLLNQEAAGSFHLNREDESSQRRGGAQQAGVRGRVKSPAEMFVLQK